MILYTDTRSTSSLHRSWVKPFQKDSAIYTIWPKRKPQPFVTFDRAPCRLKDAGSVYFVTREPPMAPSVNKEPIPQAAGANEGRYSERSLDSTRPMSSPDSTRHGTFVGQAALPTARQRRPGHTHRAWRNRETRTCQETLVTCKCRGLQRSLVPTPGNKLTHIHISSHK